MALESTKVETGLLPASGQPALPAVRLSPCFEATPLGLVVTGSPSFDEWVEIGEKLRAVEKGVQWCIGDWLAYGEGWYPDRFAQALDGTDYSRRALQNMAFVCTRIPMRRRRRLCKFSHHTEVASLEPEEQDAWLNVVEANDWSRATLRRAIKESKPSEYPIWLKYSDIWNFPQCDERFGIDFPGRIPGQAIQNLLYYYSLPGDLIIDPVAGGGTTIDVCRHEDRRCIAFDIQPQREDIAFGDATKPWPIDEQADLVFMDPPYWSQLAGEYGGIAAGSYDDYLADMGLMVRQAHKNLKDEGILALLIAPMAIKTVYIDIPFDLVSIAKGAGFQLIRRVSVPVLGKQQAGPQVMERCKKEKIMAAALRDLLIFQKEGCARSG